MKKFLKTVLAALSSPMEQSYEAESKWESEFLVLQMGV